MILLSLLVSEFGGSADFPGMEIAILQGVALGQAVWPVGWAVNAALLRPSRIYIHVGWCPLVLIWDRLLIACRVN